MNTTRVPETRCPSCRARIDAHGPVGGDFKPTPGDVSVCASCAQFLVFGEGLSIRKLTTLEYRALSIRLKEQLGAISAALQRMRRAN